MKRKKSAGSAFTWLILFVVAAALGFWAWRHRADLTALFPQKATPAASADEPIVASRQRLQGKLQVVRPPRDANIGVTAPAVALLRSVSMYEWQEHCSGDDCSYVTEWSSQHIDSQKFRTPAGHENPPAPFINARFFAGELRLDDVVIDPALVMATHAPVDFPIEASALPPNLAASFSVSDGVLYAGGDPAHPHAGMLRISYRIVPAGDVDVVGRRHGNMLEAR